MLQTRVNFALKFYANSAPDVVYKAFLFRFARFSGLQHPVLNAFCFA